MRVLIVLLAGILLAGCAKQRTMVGCWETHGENQTGTLVFKPDGTFEGSVVSPIATLDAKGSYEYKQDENSLRRHIDTWQVKGYQTTKEERDSMNAALSKDVTAVITWQSDDQVAIRSDNGEFVVANRVSK